MRAEQCGRHGPSQPAGPPPQRQRTVRSSSCSGAGTARAVHVKCHWRLLCRRRLTLRWRLERVLARPVGNIQLEHRGVDLAPLPTG
jgi:hypothetical protein